jgi:hypothetical protein
MLAPPTPAPADAPTPAPPRSRKRSRAQTIVAFAVGLPLVFVALIGVAHLPFARSLLAVFGGGGCPAAVGRATPAELESSRAASMTPLRGEVRAASRAALQFTLMKTQLPEAEAWATKAGVVCAQELKGTALRCRGVPARVAGTPGTSVAVSDLFFRFDVHGTLVAVDAMHEATSARDATTYFDEATGNLALSFGVPTETTPDVGGALAALSEPSGRASVTYRFRDLAVDLTATTFGEGEVVVREQYRAIPE